MGRKIISAVKSSRQIEEHSDEFPSLDLAFDLSRSVAASQLQRINAVDTKANFILGAATGLVSAGLVLQSLLLTDHSQSNCSKYIFKFVGILPTLLQRSLPLMPLLCIYLVVLYLAYLAYKVRDFNEAPNISIILQDYLDKDEKNTKAMVFQAMVNAYERNEVEIFRKVRYIDHAFIFLMIEAIMLVVLIVFQVAC